MDNISENMFINRLALNRIKDRIHPGKVALIYGSRRTGKTTLLQALSKSLKNEKILFLRGEEPSVQRQLSSRESALLKDVVGDHSILMVDEAQAVKDIGWNLKLLVDSMPGLKVIATGSSSFDLAQKVGEPLTGRKWTMHLYSLSAEEIRSHMGASAYDSYLDKLLVFGGYPELFSLADDMQREEYLQDVVRSALYKDILNLEGVRSSGKIRDLLRLLAYQICGEVSLSELGESLDMSKNTVARYLDLLEQSFVIVNIRGYSRNLRKEVNRTSRYYFLDNGIRNAVIENFNPVEVRDDVGKLWENWMVMERIKAQEHHDIRSNNFFWRTYDRKEIDWVEERGGKLYGYEFGYSDKSIRRSVRDEFLGAYPESELAVIHRGNYLDFVMEKKE